VGRDAARARFIACFLRYGGQICLPQAQPGGWVVGRALATGLTGYLEPGALPLEQAMTEVAEETGLDGDTVTLVLAPPPLRIERPSQGWSG